MDVCFISVKASRNTNFSTSTLLARCTVWGFKLEYHY